MPMPTLGSISFYVNNNTVTTANKSDKYKHYLRNLLIYVLAAPWFSAIITALVLSVWSDFQLCAGSNPNCSDWRFARDHSFSTFAKFSEKLTFLTPWNANTPWNVSFSENFALVLNEWTQLWEPLDMVSPANKAWRIFVNHITKTNSITNYH